MTERQIDWDEAEREFPGIREDWDLMTERDGQYRLGPDVRDKVDLFLLEPVEGNSFVEIRLRDPDGYWHYPPSWRRWKEGGWSCPLPMPKSLWESPFWSLDLTKKP